eukprot:2891869-Pyramimonas_sp.AAC.1
MILQANSFEGQLVEDIVKVKAHLSLEEEGLPARGRFLRKGNSDADIGAKHGHFCSTRLPLRRWRKWLVWWMLPVRIAF